jgi:hypothetical protein
VFFIGGVEIVMQFWIAHITSVGDWHRVDADPDPTFHLMSIQILIRIRILPRVLHVLEKKKKILVFYSQQCDS